jgi:enamine deaminase RidA (YjgF/YER057c/UK114 family)
MPTPELNLETAGLIMPSPAPALADYLPAVLDGDLVYVSGQLPFVDGRLIATGAVGDDVDLDLAMRCAERCAVNGLSAARSVLGSLDRVVRVLRVGVFVQAGPGYVDHPKVANGASRVMRVAFGEAGRHARAAVGCPSLPLGAPVEVELVLRVR